tara:strand:+ start:1329 stop:1568 length:240 start_codon:yes stop_codon:yes gene_type:complete
MSKIRKLNVDTLKRIIAEEKQKIENEALVEKKELTGKEALLNEIRTLRKLKQRQHAKIQELKDILKAQRVVKQKIVKEL